MIHIQKNNTPDFLADFVAKNPTANYDSDSFKPFYFPLREELVKEQKGLCAYCCSRITTETSHNEHIEPRNMKNGTKSRKSLDYNNIVASCNTSSTCGSHKENEYDESRFILPLDEGCEDRFSYDPDGYMNGDEYKISLLGLNSYKLKRARKSIYKTILTMSEGDIRLIYCSDKEQYWPYSNVIFWFLKETENSRISGTEV